MTDSITARAYASVCNNPSSRWVSYDPTLSASASSLANALKNSGYRSSRRYSAAAFRTPPAPSTSSARSMNSGLAMRTHVSTALTCAPV